MVKGVNKRIIEVNNTENPYFERAVLYLRPSVRELPNQVTLAEAESFLEVLGEMPRRPRNTGKKLIVLLFAAVTVAAVVLMFL